MRIALVVSTFPPYRAGMSHAAAKQAELLARAGHEVVVFTPDYGEQTDDAHRPFTVGRLKAIRYGNGALMLGLSRLTADTDAIFLHYPFFGGIEAFALRRSGPPLVLMYHMDAIGKGIWRLVFWLHRKIFLAALVKRSAVVISSTQSYGETSFVQPILKRLKRSLVVIPFSVDTKTFRPGDKPAELLESLRLSRDAPIALFVGALDRAHYFKGLDLLLEVWKDVSGHLIVVGTGAEQKKYEMLAQTLRISERVHWLGGVDDQTLADCYRLADIVIMPSIDRSEAFGLIALEAMTSGRAVIASRLPGVSSLVRDGETGILVEPKNRDALKQTIIKLLSDKELCERYGQAARTRAVDEYSEDHVGKKLDELFLRVKSGI